jgi:hypothetical protein
MIKKSYYTNGVYLVRGRKIGQHIRGKVIKTKYPTVYKKGEKIIVPINYNQFHKIEGVLLEMELKRSY